MPTIITLTTDFGVGSSYVAQMKGVILSICRDVHLIDLTHAIKPQNVREGAIVLADCGPRFPPGTIHVAVVDPGVGTSRRIVYAELGEQRYLAPDNGLLSLLAEREQVWQIVTVENSQFWLPQPSMTFHGRDIFAPVAAHLAEGLNPLKLGQKIDSVSQLDWTPPRQEKQLVAGEVVFVDSFGNLITNIPRQAVTLLGEPASLLIECDGQVVQGIVPTYGAAGSGELVALFDSQDRLEIAKVGGSAARTLQIIPGDAIVVRQAASTADGAA
jgi:S-adenosylmethionine hydrolase